MSELAGVLAHEIGHVTRRHSVQQMQQAQGANIGLALACTLARVCESGASQAAINIGGSALFAKFSRSASQLQGLTKDTPAFQTFRRRLMALSPSPAPKKP